MIGVDLGESRIGDEARSISQPSLRLVKAS